MVHVQLDRPLRLVTPGVDGDVLMVLARAEAAFTAPQVHRLAGDHSESGIRKSLRRLEQQGIVRSTRAGQAWLHALNREHLAARYVVALANLRTALIERIESAVAGWSRLPEFAALFGSAATGGMRTESDIDIFVVRPDAVDLDDETWRAQLVELASSVASWTGNDAQILEYSAGEVARGMRRKGERVLRDIAAKGIPVFGPERYLQRARTEH